MDDLDRHLDDVVLFELPAHEHVEAFCARIRPRWNGWSETDENLGLFTAELEGSRDLAPLLREAQQLLAELGLTAISYLLDGRVYVLEATRHGAAVDLASTSKQTD